MDKYFKVIAVEGASAADILLYGYIGQDYWWSDTLKEESITDLEFVRTLRDLEKDYSRINVRINGPGGSMFHGNAIITAIQNSKADIHTYNDGLAASMCADIWLAGKYRHMAKNALLMIHSPSSWAFGTAKEMRQEADVLDKFEHTAIVILMEVTGLTKEEAKEQYYDYEDHWMTAEEVEDLGMIKKVEDYEVQDPIQDAEKMTLQNIIKVFAEKGDANAKKWLDEFQKLQQKVVNSFTKRTAIAKSLNIKTDSEMKIEDFKKSLKDGELSLEEVIKNITEQGYEVTQKEVDPPPPAVAATPAAVDMAAISKAFETATKPMMDEINVLKEKVQKFGENPGDKPTGVPADQDPVTEEGENTLLKAFNEKMNAAANANDNILITSGTTVTKK